MNDKNDDDTLVPSSSRELLQVFFWLANMKLLLYSHTNGIYRSMSPARIPENRTILMSPKFVKKTLYPLKETRAP